MNAIKSYHLVKEGGTYVLIVQLDKIDTEFSNEYGETDEVKKKKFYDEIKAHIEKKFPKIKIPLCKIMVGSILIATIPLSTNVAFAAADTNITQSAMMEYKVASGDTLWRIARKFNLTVDELKSINGLTSDALYVNEILKVPNNGFIPYKVQPGDTLYKISQVYGVSVEGLKNLNNLTSDSILIGQNLIIKVDNESSPVVTNSIYKVQAGDTLWRISQKFNLTVEQLKSFNNLTSDNIYTGQELKTAITTTENIPSSPTSTLQPIITYKDYQIKSGDNLWKISIDWGIPQSELMLVNNLNESSLLRVGQIIRIPVHNIPIKETMGIKFGEHLEWWTEAQYVFPINKVAKVTDFHTGKTFTVKRTIGANHADSEPLTYVDTEIAKSIWGGYSWKVRPVIVEVDGRKIAASMSFMPHGVQYITNNQFEGHFDIHFLNSTRHSDGQIDSNHQNAINIAAGITGI